MELDITMARRHRRTFNHLLIASLLLVATTAGAFHHEGAAACAACHVMHGEVPGQVAMIDGDPILVAANATDVCLSCHGGQDGVFGHNPLDPPTEHGAGNFTFLLEDNLNDGPDGPLHPIDGEAAGHSVVSLEMGVEADSRWLESPGGTFPVAALGCTSCHDPHGNTSFRMLNGAGPIQGGLYEFVFPAPEAVGLDPMDPTVGEGPAAHSAYRSGMARWCGNCHGEYHEEDGGEGYFEHTGDHQMSWRTVRIYNRYDGTDNPDGGDPALAYLPAVPFESATSTIDRTSGPIGADRVMCLSCHRAHASSGPASGRWDFNVQYLDDDGDISGSYPIDNPYHSPEQGSLCQKCHGVSVDPG